MCLYSHHKVVLHQLGTRRGIMVGRTSWTLQASSSPASTLWMIFNGGSHGWEARDNGYRSLEICPSHNKYARIRYFIYHTYTLCRCCLIELSTKMKFFLSVLSNVVVTNHMWLLNTWNMSSATDGLILIFSLSINFILKIVAQHSFK